MQAASSPSCPSSCLFCFLLFLLFFVIPVILGLLLLYSCSFLTCHLRIQHWLVGGCVLLLLLHSSRSPFGGQPQPTCLSPYHTFAFLCVRPVPIPFSLLLSPGLAGPLKLEPLVFPISPRQTTSIHPVTSALPSPPSGRQKATRSCRRNENTYKRSKPDETQHGEVRYTSLLLPCRYTNIQCPLRVAVLASRHPRAARIIEVAQCSLPSPRDQ